MFTKDSDGNDLPKRVRLNSRATAEEIAKALTISSFLTVVCSYLQKGYHVTYLKEFKTAYIKCDDGEELGVTHD